MRSRICQDFLSCIGKTPLLCLDKVKKNLYAQITAKMEGYNPTGSIKDRTALFMLEDAEKRNLISSGSTIIESTSGNTGVSLAALCAIKEYRLIITLPDTVSEDRRRLLKAYGAELQVTPAESGMKGAIQKAMDLSEQIHDSLHVQQFSNPSNTLAHFKTTGVEIWDDTRGEVDILVAGVGTGGTVTGAGSYLKKKKPSVKVYAVEPKESAVLSGGHAGRHGIQGIGAGFVPAILDMSVLDGVLAVKAEDAVKEARLLAKEAGLLVGISSGAVLCASLELAMKPENKGKLIVAVFPDSGEKYLNMRLLK
ncbi:MAG: cysteine synthase A [Spirochaetales bacterium]|nr:cysteine synthase A [Spirochaetales bacterium]